MLILKIFKYLFALTGILFWSSIPFLYWFILGDEKRHVWAITTDNSFIKSLQLGSGPAIGGLFIALFIIGLFSLCFWFLFFSSEKYLINKKNVNTQS